MPFHASLDVGLRLFQKLTDGRLSVYIFQDDGNSLYL
jgi:hypothetical protein